jgi:protease I
MEGAVDVRESLRERKLAGREVAVLIADGFEVSEFSVPVSALRLEGARITVVSLRHGRIRGVNLHEPAHRVRADLTVDEADPADFDALLIPGGLINPDLLRQSAGARAFVADFDHANKPIASLCHGPWVLASAGLVEDRTMTSWPGIRDDLVHAGATWLDEDVVRDGNWVTSRGPQDLAAFVPAVVELFAEAAPTRARHPRREASAAQRSEPPAAMLEAMRWMPRPSLRGFAVGLLVGGLAAARARR